MESKLHSQEMGDTKPKPVDFSQQIQENQQQVEDDDDIPSLSSYALAALKEFLAEQKPSPNHSQSQQHDQDDDDDDDDEGEVRLVSEDWNLSQFWYAPQTAKIVAQEVFDLVDRFSDENDVETSTKVACIACPTLFAYLKKMYPDVSAQLLEYDNRFKKYGSDFTFYDYNLPEDLPQEMKHAYQIIVADPPYLSEECLQKVARTISFLVKPGKSFVLLLTGAVQKDRAAKLLGLHPCGFRPEHASKLGNEFRLYTNYDPGSRLGGWELED